MKCHVSKGLNSYLYVVLSQDENEDILKLDNVDQNTTDVSASKITCDVYLKLNLQQYQRVQTDSRKCT